MSLELMDFLFINHGSVSYPSLNDFKNALSHLNVRVFTNDLILDSNPIPYFAVEFMDTCETYSSWVEMYERNDPILVSTDIWTYRAI